MASASAHFNRAVALHREAAAHVEAARVEHARQQGTAPASDGQLATYQRLAHELNSAAAQITPGWLGCPLDGRARAGKLGVDARLGDVMHVDAATGLLGPRGGEVSEFAVAVPFLGIGHVAVDRDARDPRVAGWMRGLLLRSVAALPDGGLRVLPVDGATLGSLFTPFRGLVDAQVWATPATTVDRLRAVLDEAEERVAAAHGGIPHDMPYLLIAAGGLPVGAGSTEHARLAALAHAGPAARVHLLLAGYPPTGAAGFGRPPRLDHTTHRAANADLFIVSETPADVPLDRQGGGLACPVRLADPPIDGLIEAVCHPLANAARTHTAVDFTGLMPPKIWTESSASGLRTVVGREGRAWCELALDDATPHWLVAGRTGAGKTVFLLDVLYGLTSRYSPDELALYLLDFKEGISFAEFTPTEVDGSWIPHARTVGIESDREYGLAVLRTLSREMSRRAAELKRAGVTRLVDLRANRDDVAMPRLVAVIDEFQVLFTGNDVLARQAAAALEELARKGRSYGIHLILASQTISGVEALFTKGESIFGQFPLRIALAGGGGILDASNTAADALPVGSAVVNAAAGHPDANRLVRFPNAEPAAVTTQRHRLWSARPPGDAPPAVFAGYAEHHIDTDAAYRRLTPNIRRRQALVGRAVDVGLPTVGFGLDATPGRHVAVLGTSIVGADIVHAAALSLARQHQPGTARFFVAGFDAAGDQVIEHLTDTLTVAGHPCVGVDAAKLRAELAALADADTAPVTAHTYLLVFAADVATAALSHKDSTGRTGLADLRTVLHTGPGRGVHLIGWWRIARRFSEAIGGSSGREDVACLVALNVANTELAALVGDHTLTWHPRTNRALLLDRHDQRAQLIVPYVRPGRHDDPGDGTM
ncbi:FtsK/SpoIIIE domain-containing protein [Virgisporangium ochraceum]